MINKDELLTALVGGKKASKVDLVYIWFKTNILIIINNNVPKINIACIILTKM